MGLGSVATGAALLVSALGVGSVRASDDFETTAEVEVPPFCAVSLVSSGSFAAMTGEWNYQGGTTLSTPVEGSGVSLDLVEDSVGCEWLMDSGSYSVDVSLTDSTDGTASEVVAVEEGGVQLDTPEVLFDLADGGDMELFGTSDGACTVTDGWLFGDLIDFIEGDMENNGPCQVEIDSLELDVPALLEPDNTGTLTLVAPTVRFSLLVP